MIDKRHMFLFLLKQAPIVTVIVNCQRSGAVLPEHLRTERSSDGKEVPRVGVNLTLGLNMPRPIPDLIVDGTGISATLSFNNEPFKVSLPWRNIFVMSVQGAADVWWEDDFPSGNDVDAAPPSSPPRGGLRSV